MAHFLAPAPRAQHIVTHVSETSRCTGCTGAKLVWGASRMHRRMSSTDSSVKLKNDSTGTTTSFAAISSTWLSAMNTQERRMKAAVTLPIAGCTTSSPQRVCLVTGANKGIGKEIARKLGACKDTICIMGCRDMILGRAAAEELKDSGCNVTVVQIDLELMDSVEGAAQFIEQEYGRLDVLVNNAAVCFNDATLYGKVPFTKFDKQADITIRTNFFGTLAVTQAMLPMLRNATSPRIINIASSAGRLSILRSQSRIDAFTSSTLQMKELEAYMHEFVADAKEGSHTDKGWPNTGYGVSKVGIIAMTRILARDEPGMMVNSVDPGYCATDQNNSQGYLPAEQGAQTPFLLATLPDDQFFTALHWYQAKAVEW
eukprot:CAMPEP_0114231978 /NCGR_PEP_ID=MMETSP0058-20121206/4350_1 /TAXON_ID=36894 /ORGANISM="Pyramimonas parkeae, CCMP726" /LENGTH=370 /DNA_ID=CAMNT_0001343399 /DNA_START=236 /DNA_END=1345 /DNA_ORIENTATION=+